MTSGHDLVAFAKCFALGSLLSLYHGGYTDVKKNSLSPLTVNVKNYLWDYVYINCNGVIDLCSAVAEHDNNT